MQPRRALPGTSCAVECLGSSANGSECRSRDADVIGAVRGPRSQNAPETAPRRGGPPRARPAALRPAGDRMQALGRRAARAASSLVREASRSVASGPGVVAFFGLDGRGGRKTKGRGAGRGAGAFSDGERGAGCRSETASGTAPQMASAAAAAAAAATASAGALPSRSAAVAVVPSPGRSLSFASIAGARGVAEGAPSASVSPPPSPSPPSRLRRRALLATASTPRPLFLFLSGAASGALARTASAPLDRLKLLMQVGGGRGGSAALVRAARGGDLPALAGELVRTEGLGALWRGNLPQVLRVAPNAAIQLGVYELLKRRLLAGAVAGSVALALTYPLDTLRLRCAVDAACRTPGDALRAVLAEQGAAGLYRGLPAAVLGSAPYVALELAAYDLLPDSFPPALRGFLSAAGATGLCYPLDTVRRRVQMAGRGATMAGALRDALREGGPKALYRGIVPSSLKNLPAKTVKLGVFGTAKKIYARAQEERRRADEEARERDGSRTGVDGGNARSMRLPPSRE